MAYWRPTEINAQFDALLQPPLPSFIWRDIDRYLYDVGYTYDDLIAYTIHVWQRGVDKYNWQDWLGAFAEYMDAAQ